MIITYPNIPTCPVGLLLTPLTVYSFPFMCFAYISKKDHYLPNDNMILCMSWSVFQFKM